MECIISIIAAVTTFVMNIIDFLDKHDGSIMCFLTFGIMIFAAVTAKIAKQKRKDDLFKIRWKFYQEIVKYIKNTYEKKYEHKFGQWIDIDEEKQQKIQDDFVKSRNLTSDEKLDLERHFLISKAKRLFDDEVANLIQEFAFDHSIQLIYKSVYQISIDLTHNPHPQSLIREINEEYFTLSWLPSPEFEQLFDKYLKLK